MNNGAKGVRKERQCLQELIEYIRKQGYPIITSWRAMRSRAGGNDFLDGWDLGVLAQGPAYVGTEREDRMLFLVQVKSKYYSKDEEHLREVAVGKYCYLALYDREPRKDVTIKLPHFWLIKV